MKHDIDECDLERSRRRNAVSAMTLPVMLGFQSEGSAGRAPRAWPKFMTARVAADYCDSSPWTIRRHVRPCGRRGRTLVYSIDSIEEWMRGQTLASTRSETPVSKPRASVPNATPRNRVRDLAKPHDRSGPDVERRDDHVAA